MVSTWWGCSSLTTTRTCCARAIPYVLRAGDPVGERLGRVAAERGMLLMLCDQCALERGLAEGEIGAAVAMGTVDGVSVGCFPDLYAALAGDPPDHVITL